jgi:hypothetical protein
MKGRKRKQDSRAGEIRERLLVWEQESESSRPSLRSLARDLGTSHQLLSHYLEGLGVWQATRQMNEYQRLRVYGRKFVGQMLVVAMEKALVYWRRQARKKKLTTEQVETLEELTSKGHKGARKILENMGR